MGFGFALAVGVFAIAVIAAVGMFAYIEAQGPFAVEQSRKELTGIMETIALEFPDELKAWGGREVLNDPAAVRAIRNGLAEPGGASDSGPSSVRSRLLGSMLGSLAEALRTVQRRDSVPAIRIFLVAQVIGWAFGFFTAGCLGMYQHPYAGLFDWGFDVLVFNVGIAAGTAAFLVAIAIQIGVWRWNLSQSRQIVSAGVRDLSAEFPVAIENLGGEHAMHDLSTVERLTKHLAEIPDSIPLELRRGAVQILLDRLSALLRERDALKLPLVRILAISLPIAYIFGHLFGEAIHSNLYPFEGYFVDFRASTFAIGAILGGIAMGLVWLAGIAGAQIWMWYRQRAGLAVKADELRLALEGPFAAEVRSWGGPAILRDANTVADVSRSLVAGQKN